MFFLGLCPDPYGIKNTSLNINIQNKYGKTGFHLACIARSLKIVKF